MKEATARAKKEGRLAEAAPGSLGELGEVESVGEASHGVLTSARIVEKATASAA